MASTPHDGTEDLLKTYSPSDGLTDATSVMKGIDNIEKRSRNKYLNDSEMARITDDGTMKLARIHEEDHRLPDDSELH
jgi:hypothetical protein